MTMRVFAAVSAGLMLAASLGAAAPAPAAPVVPLASTMAAAVMFQQYYPGTGVYCFDPTHCYPVGYHHDVYSDAGLTNLIGSGDDTCSSYGEYVYVNTPSLPTGYEVKTPMWVCTPDGITLVDF